jgi:hypothetical protein
MEDLSSNTLFSNELNGLYTNFNISNFLEFQKFLNEKEQVSSASSMNQENAFTKKILTVSQVFRSNLRNFISELSSFAEYVVESESSSASSSTSSSLEEKLSFLEKQHTILTNIQQYWSLMELFSLSSSASNSSASVFPTSSPLLPFQLISWLRSSASLPFSGDEVYNSFLSMTHPERSSDRVEVAAGGGGRNGGGEGDYWKCLYLLTLQGKLKAVIELLKLHSEIRSFFSFSSNAVAVFSFSSSVGKEQIIEFFHLIESYPFYDCLTILDEPEEDEEERERKLASFFSSHSSPLLIASLTEWSSSVQQYRQHSSFITKIPELDMILRVLLGEKQIFERIVRNAYPPGRGREREGENSSLWKLVSLGSLLYSYPLHQLTKSNMKRILDESLQQYK